jgi:anti-sigma regulatory factor (Ser/Thr protein kinase)
MLAMETTEAAFAPNLDAMHECRAFTLDFLARQDADDLSMAATLIVTELVTNVVRHAHSPIRIRLDWDDDTLHVEVQDGSSILPAVTDLAGEDGGYGLRIVKALTEEWGIRPLAEGKAVWCNLKREPVDS